MTSRLNGTNKSKLIEDYNGRWEENRAFIYAVKDGRDKAFPSMSAYIKRRDEQVSRYRKLRKEKPVKHGERFNSGFEMSGVWERLQPAVFIVFFIGLIAWALGTGQFKSNERATLDVFGTGKAIHFVFLPEVNNGAASLEQVTSLHFNPGIIITVIALFIFLYAFKRWIDGKRKGKSAPVRKLT